jgi:hypothetical protein
LLCSGAAQQNAQMTEPQRAASAARSRRSINNSALVGLTHGATWPVSVLMIAIASITIFAALPESGHSGGRIGMYAKAQEARQFDSRATHPL